MRPGRRGLQARAFFGSIQAECPEGAFVLGAGFGVPGAAWCVGPQRFGGCASCLDCGIDEGAQFKIRIAGDGFHQATQIGFDGAVEPFCASNNR